MNNRCKIEIRKFKPRKIELEVFFKIINWVLQKKFFNIFEQLFGGRFLVVGRYTYHCRDSTASSLPLVKGEVDANQLKFHVHIFLWHHQG